MIPEIGRRYQRRALHTEFGGQQQGGIRTPAAHPLIFLFIGAAGRCEACRRQAPFTDKSGKPYLEVHHIDRLSDGGPDHPATVAALCPNCHAHIHRGSDGDECNEFLRNHIASLEDQA